MTVDAIVFSLAAAPGKAKELFRFPREDGYTRGLFFIPVTSLRSIFSSLNDRHVLVYRGHRNTWSLSKVFMYIRKYCSELGLYIRVYTKMKESPAIYGDIIGG